MKLRDLLLEFVDALYQPGCLVVVHSLIRQSLPWPGYRPRQALGV